MRTVLSPVSPVPCSFRFPLVNAVLLVRGGWVFLGWTSLRKAQSQRVLLSILGKLHMAEKRRGVRQLLALTWVTSCLSKPVVHLVPPCVKKLRPAKQEGAQDLSGNKVLSTRAPLRFQRFYGT